MLILCSPHNPIGRVWKKQELLKLAEICLKHNILILSDEIHSDLTYKGYKHIATASISEEISARTVTFIAPAKPLTWQAWRLPTLLFLINNSGINIKVMDNLHVASGNIFGVLATEAAYRYGWDWLNELMQYLELNLDYLENFIHDKLPRIRMIRPEATYLVWLDFRELGLSQKELKAF